MEAADARLQNRQNNPEDFRDGLPEGFYQDSQEHSGGGEYSTLSVKSIILFLEDLVESQLESNFHDHTFPEDDHNLAPWLKVGHSNDLPPIPSEKAIKAYMQAAKTSHGPLHNRDAHETYMRENDLKEVYSLVKLLRSLEAQGVKYLKIDGHRSFITAISLAVEKNSEPSSENI